MTDKIVETISDVVAANRILAMEGVLDGFGHVSIRNPQNPQHYFMSRSIAPATVTADDVIEHNMQNSAVHEKDSATKLYYERWIHGEVYKLRPEVNAVVHSHSPTVVPFASTKTRLRPLLHNACFLGFGTPVFEIRDLTPDSDLMIGSAELGRAMAEKLGKRAEVVLLRGHGNVVVGPSIQIAVYRAYYTEINARQQLQAETLDRGNVVYMNDAECATTDKIMQASAGRPWDLWKHKAMQDSDKG